MEVLPIGDRRIEDFKLNTSKADRPTACLGFAKDDDGTIRPLLYSFARSVWLTGGPNEVARQLPDADQAQLNKLLMPSIKATKPFLSA